MELYTLDRAFLKQENLDVFHSVIWTERYYGDSDFEIVVDPTPAMFATLAKGTFVGYAGSREIMMIETLDTETGKLKATGISLTQWLNNRFIRTSALHEDRHWTIENQTPGQMMANIVYYMCIDGEYLNGMTPIGIDNPAQLTIPGLTLGDWVKEGPQLTIAVPFGPVYDALREIATTHEIGMQIVLVSATDAGYSLQYRNYRGIDHTSQQDVYGLVRFSPGMDSLTDIKEVQSIANLKTQVWAFVPANPGELATTPGYEGLSGAHHGFDLRALMIFTEDITTDQVEGDEVILLDVLNARAHDALMNSKLINVVDGEIVPNAQFKYGVDYNLGDLVEMQGLSGTIKRARVTEYIRTQDDTGERAYPTVSVIDQ